MEKIQVFFFLMVLQKLDIHKKKIKTINLYFTWYSKINLCSTYLVVKANTIKLLEENKEK